MLKIAIYPTELGNPSIYLLAQTSNRLENASKIISEITLSKIIQGFVVIGLAYGGLWAIDKLIHWLKILKAIKHVLYCVLLNCFSYL